MDAYRRRLWFSIVIVVVWMGGYGFFVTLVHQRFNDWFLAISSVVLGVIVYFVLLRGRRPGTPRPLPTAVNSMPKLLGWSILYAVFVAAMYLFGIRVYGPVVALLNAAFMAVVLVIWFVTVARRIRAE